MLHFKIEAKRRNSIFQQLTIKRSYRHVPDTQCSSEKSEQIQLIIACSLADHVFWETAIFRYSEVLLTFHNPYLTPPAGSCGLMHETNPIGRTWRARTQSPKTDKPRCRSALGAVSLDFSKTHSFKATDIALSLWNH